MARIRLENISKTFGTHVAVEDLDLDVADGEFFVLLGPTGAGKTTTLRMIAGLEKPTVGRVYINETDVNDWGPAERDVALVLQQYSLYPRLTVRENLSFPLRSRIRRMSEADIDKRIEYASKTLRIGHLLERKTDRLSGGEMQRVSIGRAIVREPQVFLMDEPLSALDAKLREAMQVELRQLQQRLGITTIVVTHDQREAMTMADLVVVMGEGRIRQAAPPIEIYRRPADAFVADFIGSTNLLAIAADGAGRATVFGRPVPGLAMPSGMAKAVLSVRPEDVRLGAPGAGAFDGTVTFVRDLGATIETFVEAGGETIVAVAAPRDKPDVKVGQTVGVVLSPDDCVMLAK